MGEARDVSGLLREEGIVNPDIIETLFLDEESDLKQFLFNQNDRVCGDIIQEISQLKELLGNEPTRAASIEKLMDLLANLAYLCQNANNLSDSRIHVVSMLKQMKTLLPRQIQTG